MEDYENMFRCIKELADDTQANQNDLVFRAMLDTGVIPEELEKELFVSIHHNVGILWAFDNNFLKEYINSYTLYNDELACIYESLYYIGAHDSNLSVKKRQKLLKELESLHLTTKLRYEALDYGKTKISFYNYGIEAEVHPLESFMSFNESTQAYKILSNSGLCRQYKHYGNIEIARGLKTSLVFGYLYLNNCRYIKSLIDYGGYYIDAELHMCIPKAAVVKPIRCTINYEPILHFEEFLRLSYEEIMEYILSFSKPATLRYVEKDIERHAFKKMYMKYNGNR